MIEILSIKERLPNKLQQETLFQIMTHAYAETESSMFGNGYVRTSQDDFLAYVNTNQLLVAYKDGETVVGGVRHFFKDRETYSFGNLATDFTQLGQGIGNMLVERVEEEAIRKGAKRIEIEILKPREESLLIKEQLASWYLRIGYELSGSIPLELMSESKASETIQPCLVDTYIKNL